MMYRRTRPVSAGADGGDARSAVAGVDVGAETWRTRSPPCEIRHVFTVCILQGGCLHRHTPALPGRYTNCVRGTKKEGCM